MGSAATVGPVHVCTIAARNYLPRAMVLAESFRRHHPDGVLEVCVVDDRTGEVDLGDHTGVIALDELDMPVAQLHAMAYHYDVTELSTALKPWVLEAAQRRHPGPVLYLDPDIEVFGSLDHLRRLADEQGIALTPHVLRPFPHDDRTPSELDVFRAGVYNLGFLGVGPDAGAFLRWWQDRLVVGAVIRPEEGLFTDQKWIDVVPSLFEHALVTDPGCNVAYWNLHERPLGRTADGYTAAGEPLVFFHFSGYRPGSPDVLSRHAGDRPRARPTDDPVLAELCERYGQRVNHWAGELTVESGYGWDRLGNGIPVDPAMRRVLHRAATEARHRPGAMLTDPTTDEGLAATMALLLAPTALHGLPRYLEAKLDDRPDVRAAYLRSDGYDGPGLAGWVREHAVAEGEITAPLAEALAAVVADPSAVDPGASPQPVPSEEDPAPPLPEAFAVDLPPMVSYAQNGEDVVLRRVFHDLDTGFYIDVGAADPRRDSVTCHFVEHGWTGIDVEPQPDHVADLRRERPTNVVVEAVVGARPGRTVLHVVPAAPGRSSISPDAVQAYRDQGIELVPIDVRAVTLAELCERHRPSGPIHFLKIDAEGAEADVVAGGDWERFRPWVVVAEVENAGPEHDSLTVAMDERGYRPVLYDGLNRFYLAEEHPELEERLRAPANINDAATWYVHTDQVRALEQQVGLLTARLASSTPEAASADPASPPPSTSPGGVAAWSARPRRWLAPAGSRREAAGRAVLARVRRWT